MSVKSFSAIVCLILILTLTALPVSADASRVVDRLGAFSDAELSRLNESIAAAEENSDGIAIYIVTAERRYSNSEMPTVVGRSRSDDLCILLIEDDLHYTLYTYGKADDRVSNGEVDDLLDDDGVYGNIKSGRVFEGALRFVELAPAALGVPYSTIITVSLILGGIAAAIAVGTVVSKYKMKSRPTNYPLERYATMDLTSNEDQFIGKHVAVVVTSSGSHGGRGGRGGGGGARGGR